MSHVVEQALYVQRSSCHQHLTTSPTHPSYLNSKRKKGKEKEAIYTCPMCFNKNESFTKQL